MSGAQPPHQNDQAYAGEVTARDAWDRLAGDGSALLVDVRTRAEWSFVGMPDLTSVSRPLVRIEWQSFPAGPGPNPDFLQELRGELTAAGRKDGAALYFICRSGGRSRQAAISATRAGIGPCFNVSDGFEGNLDAERHRGRTEGWKAAGLPWVQT